uniref:ARAD1D36432p n=1 Tax=Blastobotrys adeninivorans TaxID=409370 RepID=A0A060TI63_BLAAD
MSSSTRKRGNPIVELIAGGTAGCMEAVTCHPLDTIKVRMQLRRRAVQAAKQVTPNSSPATAAAQEAVNATGESLAALKSQKPKGFVRTGIDIVKKETPLGLYKGLGAVITGITPKMALRFSTYEFLKRKLAPSDGSPISAGRTFVAGVGAGITEAVVVVNPTEVVKIRLQAQAHSMADPVNTPKYRNALHCAYTVARTEGLSALYRGVTLTAARQASNQGVNFTVYSTLKKKLETLQPQYEKLPSWQTSIIGLISGALGPLSNAPLDTIKTRMQREHGHSTESGLSRFMRISRQLVHEEGTAALYRGITPRIMRVAPGQAVTFTVYEYMRTLLESKKLFAAKLDS